MMVIVTVVLSGSSSSGDGGGGGSGYQLRTVIVAPINRNDVLVVAAIV